MAATSQLGLPRHKTESRNPSY